MISLVILLILAWSFYIGYSRGIVLQTYYTISAIVSAIIAGLLYQSLGEQINLVGTLCECPGRDIYVFFSK